MSMRIHNNLYSLRFLNLYNAQNSFLKQIDYNKKNNQPWESKLKRDKYDYRGYNIKNRSNVKKYQEYQPLDQKIKGDKKNEIAWQNMKKGKQPE